MPSLLCNGVNIINLSGSSGLLGSFSLSLRPKLFITKTYLYNTGLYIVTLGFTGLYTFFLISAQKHRLWIFARTASPRRF